MTDYTTSSRRDRERYEDDSAYFSRMYSISTYKPGFHYFVSKFAVRWKLWEEGVLTSNSHSRVDGIEFAPEICVVPKSKSKLGPDWWG